MGTVQNVGISDDGPNLMGWPKSYGIESNTTGHRTWPMGVDEGTTDTNTTSKFWCRLFFDAQQVSKKKISKIDNFQ